MPIASESVAGGMSCEGFQAGHVLRGFGVWGVCLCGWRVVQRKEGVGMSEGGVLDYKHVPLTVVLCHDSEHGLSARGGELVH